MARSFNGSSDQIDLGSSALLPATSDWTIAVKVKPGTSIAGSVCFSQYIAIGGNGRFLLRLLDTDVTHFSLFLGDQSTFPTANVDLGVISSSAWSLVAASRSGAVFSGYVNTSKTTHTDASAGRSLLQTGNIIGARSTAGVSYNGSPGSYWAGSVAELAIWNVTLSDTEITSLAADYSPLRIRPASLTVYIPMRRNLTELHTTRTLTASGTTVTDHPRIYC